MKKNRSAYLFFVCFSISLAHFSQTTQKIRIRKDQNSFVFFQKGKSKDTISPDRHDLFYLTIPDTLKNDLTFWVENAQLQSFQADTVLKIKYVPGLRYEAYFVKKDSAEVKYKWSNFVNGAAALEKNKIRIQVFDKRDHDLLLENNFIYTP